MEQLSNQNNIPKHWKAASLIDDLPYIKTGVTDYKGKKKYFSTGSIKSDSLIAEGKYTFAEKPSRANRIVSKGDVLQARMKNTDKAILIDSKLDGQLFSTGFFQIRADETTINSKFIFYYLQSLKFKKTKDELCSGSTQEALNDNGARKIKIPIPPFEEQEKIVLKIEGLFSDLDNGKQQLQTAQQQLKVYRQSLLKWAFEGKLTQEWRTQQVKLPSSEQLIKKIKSERDEIISLKRIKQKHIQPISDEEFEELEKLPKGMAWVKLGEILWSVKDGPHYSPKYQENGVPFISGGNIRPDGIDFNNVKFISNEFHEELSRRCKPEKGDVLYTKGGTTGIARVNNYDIDFNVWVHVAVLKIIPSINPFYLQHVLNSNHCYKQSQKYTHGVGNQDLGLTRMINITLPICSSEEQVQIVQELESKLTVCDKIEETISQSLLQAEALRQSILKKAFEGKLVSLYSDSDEVPDKHEMGIAAEPPMKYKSNNENPIIT